jgi:uncharacterized protein YjbJ (UPF0337 family)
MADIRPRQNQSIVKRKRREHSREDQAQGRDRQGRSVGRATGNRRLRTKGREEKATGNAKQAVGRMKAAFKH